MDILSFKDKMHGKLINSIINFVCSFMIVIGEFIWWGLWIDNNQALRDGHVKFLGG